MNNLSARQSVIMSTLNGMALGVSLDYLHRKVNSSFMFEVSKEQVFNSCLRLIKRDMIACKLGYYFSK